MFSGGGLKGKKRTINGWTGRTEEVRLSYSKIEGQSERDNSWGPRRFITAS